MGLSVALASLHTMIGRLREKRFGLFRGGERLQNLVASEE